MERFLGLGMIVKRLLDRTGGEIAIESEKRVGTSVQVSLQPVSPQQILEKWHAHLSGGNRARRVCQALTFEIWLQQVYEGRFRGDGDLPSEVAT